MANVFENVQAIADKMLEIFEERDFDKPQNPIFENVDVLTCEIYRLIAKGE